jgi:hypothetical protein
MVLNDGCLNCSRPLAYEEVSVGWRYGYVRWRTVCPRASMPCATAAATRSGCLLVLVVEAIVVVVGIWRGRGCDGIVTWIWSWISGSLR